MELYYQNVKSKGYFLNLTKYLKNSILSAVEIVPNGLERFGTVQSALSRGRFFNSPPSPKGNFFVIAF